MGLLKLFFAIGVVIIQMWKNYGMLFVIEKKSICLEVILISHILASGPISVMPVHDIVKGCTYVGKYLLKYVLVKADLS